MPILSKDQIQYIENPKKYKKNKGDNSEYQMRKRIRNRIKNTSKELLTMLKLLKDDKLSKEIRDNFLSEEFVMELIYQFFKLREESPDLLMMKRLEMQITTGTNANKNGKMTWEVHINPELASKFGRQIPLREC
jgi:ATP-dependent Clp protease adapter protein ClpS